MSFPTTSSAEASPTGEITSIVDKFKRLEVIEDEDMGVNNQEPRNQNKTRPKRTKIPVDYSDPIEIGRTAVTVLRGEVEKRLLVRCKSSRFDYE